MSIPNVLQKNDVSSGLRGGSRCRKLYSLLRKFWFSTRWVLKDGTSLVSISQAMLECRKRMLSSIDSDGSWIIKSISSSNTSVRFRYWRSFVFWDLHSCKTSSYSRTSFSVTPSLFSRQSMLDTEFAESQYMTTVSSSGAAVHDYYVCYSSRLWLTADWFATFQLGLHACFRPLFGACVRKLKQQKNLWGYRLRCLCSSTDGSASASILHTSWQSAAH